jgi:hypothetical protein
MEMETNAENDKRGRELVRKHEKNTQKHKKNK